MAKRNSKCERCSGTGLMRIKVEGRKPIQGCTLGSPFRLVLCNVCK